MMNVNLMPFLVSWALLALVVMVLVVYRLSLGRKEDDTLHVLHGSELRLQAAVSAKLEKVDKWGKSLTVLALAYGLLLAGFYAYRYWVSAATIGL